jgi:hypothetical protein
MIFTLFFAGMFATAAYGYRFGDPKKLVMPFDSDGNLCSSGNLTNYPYIYWPEITASLVTNLSSVSFSTDLLSSTACVQACPAFAEKPLCYNNTEYPLGCPTATVSTTACKSTSN